MPNSATSRAQRPVRQMPWAGFALLLYTIITSSTYDTTAAAQSRGPMRDVIRTLTVEAQEALDRNRLTISEPDFADRYEGQIDLDAAQQAITRKQNRDPFIDAYIRWQLTSFDIVLPEMNDRDRSRFFQQIPSIVENPRAARQRVEFFERVAHAEWFSEEQVAELQRLSAELDGTTESAESLSRPAVKFREWIRVQFDEAGKAGLALQLAAEHCAATIHAGWSTRAIKMEISQRCSEAADGGSLTAEERQRALVALERLVGMQRRSVNTITFMGDNSVRVTFSNAAVYRRDIDNWRSRLFDKDSNGHD